MPKAAYTCGIVVPVRDEAKVLSRTVPALLRSVGNERTRIIWVCNGCRDGSVQAIRDSAGERAEIIQIETPGKTLALQEGDTLLDRDDIFPRLYLDADTWMRAGDLERLLQPLRTGRAELVAAAHALDFSRCSALSAAMADCWLSLPFARTAAFLGAVAVSKSGRARWGRWPEVIADDMFMAAMVPPERRMMVAGSVATTYAPADFLSWVRMRARWLRGERQLLARGITIPSAENQKADLLRRLGQPRTALGSSAFCLARLLAVPMNWRSSDVHWKPDRRRT